MSEEFEVGQEMDRALRAAVTGLAQLIERSARRRADQTRAAAAEARQEWLANRDLARRQYVPLLRGGVVENGDPVAASRAWSVAAAWSAMDPEARAAQEQLADRIERAHGKHPATILKDAPPQPQRLSFEQARTWVQTNHPTVYDAWSRDYSTVEDSFARRSAERGLVQTVEELQHRVEEPTADGRQTRRLLTTREAIDLAERKAPYYWDRDELAALKPTSDRPQTEAERRVHADWQQYAESGSLPQRSRSEQSARYAGHGDDIDLDRWRTPAGDVDDQSRARVLERIWAEGADERNHGEVEAHQVAMAKTGMSNLSTQVDIPADPSAWRAMINPDTFDTATPQQAVKGWRDAAALGAAGDPAARAAAEQLAGWIKIKHGADPRDYLIAAMTERAANNAEARRAAEDKARSAAEEADAATVLTAAQPAGMLARDQARPARAEAAPGGVKLSRERVSELNKEAQAYFAVNLRPGTTGHTYLVDRLGAEVMVGPWALGYAPEAWTGLTQQLQRGGASADEILAAGLGRLSSKGNVIDAFRGRAMIGIRDIDGDLVGFVGRDLTGDKRAPRYVDTGATTAFKKSEQVFGLYEAPANAKLVRTEGAFDAIATSLAGDGEAAGVAPMGTAMSDTQAARIAQRSSDGRVWLANDQDTAGRKATEHDFYALGRQGIKAHTVTVPGADPADAWQHQPGLMQATITTLDTAPRQQKSSSTTTSKNTRAPSAPTISKPCPALTTPSATSPQYWMIQSTHDSSRCRPTNAGRHCYQLPTPPTTPQQRPNW